MRGIKHINADLLSDEELTAIDDKLRGAERRMDEKLMEEIERRRNGFERTESGIWVPDRRREDE